MRWIGYKYKGYNLISVIGPSLAAISSISILGIAAFGQYKTTRQMLEKWMWAITIYLLFTVIVHPWYIALPLFLSVFSNYRFPIIWSALITLTYINYSYTPYFENLWVVGIEYTIVFGVLIWELFIVPNKKVAI